LGDFKEKTGHQEETYAAEIGVFPKTKNPRRTICKVLLLTKERKRKKVWEHPKSGAWWPNVCSQYDDEKWLENFRVRKGTFDFICSKVRDALAPSATPVVANRSLSVEKIVAIALYKLSHVAEYQTIGNMFGVPGESEIQPCGFGCLSKSSGYRQLYTFPRGQASR